jgi:predicted nucleic acid-binding protein
MVLLDSDIFILDLFYPTDARAETNKRFLNLPIDEKVTTIFNVLEVCGIASFNKSVGDVKRLFYTFHQVYGLDILYPNVLGTFSEDSLKQLVVTTFVKILLKMNFNDALILATAESFGVSTLVTWNVKHFEHQTSVQVVTPEGFERGM